MVTTTRAFVNYGWNPQSNPYDLSPNGQVATDFAKLKAAGINMLRIIMVQYNDANAYMQIRALVAFAKSQGMIVSWGATLGGGSHTKNDFTNFSNFVVTVIAPWCVQNGIDEFSIGNEEELHVDGTTLTVAQIQAKLKVLATQVKGIFPRTISY